MKQVKVTDFRHAMAIALVLIGLLAVPVHAGTPSTEVVAKKNLAYGPHPRQRLDIHLPNGARAVPAIVMVHGGGWRIGDKDNKPVVEGKTRYWLPRGYALASVNYRMLPEADPLTQAADVAAAVAWLQQNAQRHGIDRARLVLMGHSAGAHLVSLVSVDSRLRERHGVKPVLGTVALDSAGYDIVQRMSARRVPRLYAEAFGKNPAYWRAASPSAQIAGRPAPFLLACSSQRKDSCPAADEFAAALRNAGTRAEVLPVALSHRAVNEELGRPSRYTETVAAFLKSLGLP